MDTFDRSILPPLQAILNPDLDMSEHDSDWEGEEGNKKLTPKYRSRRKRWVSKVLKGWKAYKVKIEADEAAKVLRKNDPEKWYLSSVPTVSQGTQKMVDAVFQNWYNTTKAKSTKSDAVAVILVIKKNFFVKNFFTKERGGAWKIWEDKLADFTKNDVTEKPRPSKPENVKDNVERKRQYLFEGLRTFPIMHKALHAREDLAKEVAACKADMQAKINEWGHNCKMISDPKYQTAIENGGEKWLICSDEQANKAIRTREYIQPPPQNIYETINNVLVQIEDDPVAQSNYYVRAMRWAMKKFLREVDYEYTQHPNICYGTDGRLFIESDGPTGRRTGHKWSPGPDRGGWDASAEDEEDKNGIGNETVAEDEGAEE